MKPKLHKPLTPYQMSLIGISLILVLLILLSAYSIIVKFFIPVQITQDFSEYSTSAYRQRDGGETAAEFLPTEDALSDSSEILYRHYDLRRKRAWGLDVPDLFCLSVTYRQDDYRTKLYEWIDRYFTGTDSEKEAEIERLRNDPYDSCIRLYYQEKENKRYDAFYLIFQPSKNTIHFCFFPSMKANDTDILTLIHHQYTFLSLL